ncbi:MAG: 2OG-Fe(II) oxygenase [Beijerinckiaceae bacterium]
MRNNDEINIKNSVDELGKFGYSVCKNMIPPNVITMLIHELEKREQSGDIKTALVGRGESRKTDGAQRDVLSSWLGKESEGEQYFLAFAEKIRLSINRNLLLGLFEFESQFLHYPIGGFYKRHIDALKGNRNRIVSMVAYLNQNWIPEDGGTLAIWNDEQSINPMIEVLPSAGTVVLMLSEDIPHEARSALRERRAIAGWFRLNPSYAGQINPAN